MRLVKRAAITVTPKQPYLDWANAIDEGGVKIGEDFEPEKNVYLIGDVSDVIPFDRDVIVRPYFKAIFEEELNSWHRREREWPCAGYPRHPGKNDSSSSPLVVMVQSIQNRNST
jgi:hypothetical protein